MQIDGALLAKTSTEIHALSNVLADDETFGAWRELLASDAVYITAITRVTRAERKATKK